MGLLSLKPIFSAPHGQKWKISVPIRKRRTWGFQKSPYFCSWCHFWGSYDLSKHGKLFFGTPCSMPQVNFWPSWPSPDLNLTWTLTWDRQKRKSDLKWPILSYGGAISCIMYDSMNDIASPSAPLGAKKLFHTPVLAPMIFKSEPTWKFLHRGSRGGLGSSEMCLTKT